MFDADSIEGLSLAPTTTEELKAWRAWAAGCAKRKRWPAKAPATAWRAIISDFADKNLDPQGACEASLAFLKKATEAPPHVVRAATRLAAECLNEGATTPDVLYLLAAFVWPLRDLFPKLGDDAWAHLIHAPWQTEPATLIKLFEVIDGAATHPDRALLDLVTARYGAGMRNAGRELLEAMVLVQAGCERIDFVTAKALNRKDQLEGANRAIVRLARVFVEDREVQVFAREVLERAIEMDDVSSDLRDALQQTVWDRPFAEGFQWSKGRAGRQIDEEIARLVGAGQPHQARRVAEGIIVRHFDSPLLRSAITNVPTAIDKFARAGHDEILADAACRRAAEHLSVLYVRTRQTTEDARKFVRKIAGTLEFTGAAGPLHSLKSELEEFVNANDPYTLLRDEELRIGNAKGLNDEERRVGDRINEWFAPRTTAAGRAGVDRLIGAITLPITDAVRWMNELVPAIENACAAAFRTMLEKGTLIAGDLGALEDEGKAHRKTHGISLALFDRAKELTLSERLTATLAAAATSLLPPGGSLMSTSIDLAITLVATFRSLARIGALYGIDVRTPLGFRFVADSFSLGCSSSQEGIATYLSRGKQQTVTTFTLGDVAYGGAQLANYLWTAQLDQKLIIEEAIKHLARICGFGLSSAGTAKIVPIAGAVVSAASTYVFMKSILDAGLHLAARQALLDRIDQCASDQSSD
jgi:hypothetical protein